MGDMVAELVNIVRARGLKWQLNATGTNVEGDPATLLDLAKELHEAAFRMGYSRVFTAIQMDDRRDKDLTMEYKIQSVLEKVG